MKHKNIDLGKWSVKKNNFMNVKKIPLFGATEISNRRTNIQFARVLGFLENKNIF
jgi:hypothetical protein